MLYQIVASSKSRATEVYKGLDGSLLEVYYFKSGRVEVNHRDKIDPSLTVNYPNGDGNYWEFDAIPSEGRVFNVNEPFRVDVSSDVLIG